MQIKTLLGDKDQLREVLEQRDIDLEETRDRCNNFELQISTLKEQKQSILDLLARLQGAFPAQSLQETFGHIVCKICEA